MWMMGQSAPSASLQVGQHWEEWLTHQMAAFRGTWTGRRTRLTWAFMKFNKGNAKSCTWEGITPCTRTGWWLVDWKATLHRRTCAFWWTPGWTSAGKMPCGKQGQLSPGLCEEECCQQMILPPYSTLARPHFWVPQNRRSKDILEWV